MDYLIECFKNAREEILFRVQHRDDYFKFQLLSQAVILALSQGVKTAGVESTLALPAVLTLAVPLSIVFASLFYNENRLIAHLSRYVATLPSTEGIVNFDASQHLADFDRASLLFRFFAQITAFVFIPGSLFATYLVSATPVSLGDWLLVAFEIFGLVLLIGVVGYSFNYSRHASRKNAA